VEYGCFTDVTDLPTVLERFLSDPVKLASARTAFRERARELAHTNFWGAIDDGLARRGIPLIGD
jgi:hypothetical protein